MKIIISGDMLPTPNNEKLFCDGDAEALVGKEILHIYREADFRISNMEGPLTDSETMIDKSGPHIKGSAKSIKGIKQLGVDCVSIANNHILDYGQQGLKDTLDILRCNNIDYVGAGKNLAEAKKPYIFEQEGMRVGVYSCAEYEYTIADEFRGGANPFEPMDIVDDIRTLKRECDAVIVLYHGGKEFYRYPVPYVQKRCRKMADAGADFILCQHSHCIGCVEKYKGASILYGQGNFLLCRADDEFRHTGLLVRILLNKEQKDIEFIPIVRHEEKVRIATEGERKEILDDFNSRAQEIKDADFVQTKYEEFAASLLNEYYLQALGRVGGVLSKFRMRCMTLKLFKKQNNLNLLNAIRCEAHVDVFRQGLENVLRKKNS